ncbi:Transcription-associated protein 1 [Fasciola gigantica]|uniref:Transcription-associated protein 1 n=1 Tax=Fasciola gigantica TaxID=46835 RepID=A0A504YBT4_FASGI|nr:Transcription-associated protein 1 [Fasciola gigantica]
MRPLGVCSNLNVKLSDFFNESLPLKERLKRGHDLCDGLENAVADKDMQDLTMNIYEKVQKLLTSTEPQNLQECATQKLRRLCLEILQKLPNGDHLRPYARSILSLLFKLVEIENEDNVLICVKLIIDLHKYYRPSFSSDDLVEHYSGSLVQGMMNLLINCPPSVTNMRKEFFIAARHILSAQEIRPKFLDVLDDLMNEDILIGQGYTVRDALRPLAYSTLADLTHHIRGELSLAKIARALDLYGRNMHDDTLPFSIQQMSLRLLLNLVECVRQRVLTSLSNPTGSDTTDELNTGVASGTARRLLLHTLRLCVLKCRIVAEHYLPILEATCQSASEQMESSMTFEKPTSSLLKTTKSGIEDGKNKTSTCRVNDSIASKPQLSHLDLRSLIKALMAGMRTIVTGMIQCPHEPGFGASISGSSSGSLGTKLSKSTASSAVASSAIATRFLTPDELMVLTDYFNYGMRMIDVVQIVSRDGRLYTKGQPSSKSPDERLLIETFALTFAQLSPVSFQEIFSSKISLHLRRIVQGSMQYCLTAEEPTAYLTLLRTLFRSIGGGAHDKLYREFFPLLPEMLSTLNRLLRSPHRANARDLLGELCVIVPVRLSTLLPYLSLLMEPLVYVLNCNTVNQGLRTLELCVDNMQPDFLHDHLHQVRGDMLLALYNSLHSSSEYVQKMSFKVLGKLGRFNRTNLLEVQRLRLDPGENESGPRLRFYLNEFRTQPIDLPVRSLVDAAFEVLQDVNVDLPTKTRAWELLQSVCLGAFDLLSVGLENNRTSSSTDCSFYAHIEGSEFLTAVRHFVTVANNGDGVNIHSDRLLMQSTCCVDGDLDRDVMIRSLAGLFLAAYTKPLRDSHADFIGFIVRHLTILSITQLVQYSLHSLDSDQTDGAQPGQDQNLNAPSSKSSYPVTCQTKLMEPGLNLVLPVHERYRVCHEAGTSTLAQMTSGDKLMNRPTLNPVLLVDAIQMIMGHEEKQLTRPMSVLLQNVHSTATAVIRGAHDVSHEPCTIGEEQVQKAVAQLPLFIHLGHVLIDMLHHPSWYVKWGGCATIIYLVGILHPIWFQSHFLSLLNGLMHCIHDLSSQMSQGALKMARECSRLLIQTVFTSRASTLPCVSESAGTGEGGLKTSDAPAEDDDTSGRPTSGKRSTMATRRRPPVSGNGSQARRTGSLRRGRSASISSNTSINEPEDEANMCTMDVAGEETGPSVTKPDLTCTAPPKQPDSKFIASLLTSTIRLLLDALLSETAAVREEARCLLRLLSHQLGRPLSVLLAPHWRPLLGHILPPQPPLRLPDLPVSTQLVVLVIFLFQTISTGCICSEQDVIHEEAFACLKEFVSHTSIDIELRHANVKPILQNVRQTTHLRLNTARQLSYCAQLFPSTFSERLCDAIYSHLTALVDNLRNQQNVSSILTLVPPNLELCAVLMDLFHMIPLATAKHVSCLIDLVVRAERSLNIEPTSPLRLPLVRFLARYPAETCMHLLTGSKWPYDALAHRIFLYVLKSPQGQAITDYLKTNYHILCDLIRPTDLADQKLSSTTSARYWLPRIGTPLTAACPRHLAIRAVHVIHQLFPNWLLHNPSISDESPRSSKSRYKAMCSSPTGSTGKTNSAKTTYHPVCSALLAYWRSDVFAKRQASLTLVTLSTVPSDLLPEAAADCSASDGGLLCGLEYVESEGMMNPIDPSTDSITGAPEFTLPSGEPIPMIASGTGHFEHWDEPRLILDCLLDCAKADVENFDLLFVLVIGVNRLRSVAGLYPLRCFLDDWIKEAPLGWHRRLFLHYISLVRHRLSAMADASIMADPSMVVFGGNLSITVEDMYRLMAHLILPSFAYALECGPLDELIGGPANPLDDNENDLIYLFIHVLLDDPALHVCTELRVMYYQLACLFVHFATDYIHSAPETEHSPRLRRLIDFAWCCTTSSLSVVDLQEKYTGLQLLAYLIAKFQLSPKIAVQVFQCLAKGTHTETKKIVNPALDVLIPAWVRSPSDQLPVEQRRLALDMIDTAAQWDHRCRQLLNEVQVSESSVISLATPFTEELMDIHADDDSSAQTTSHTANTTSVGSAGILPPHPAPTSCSNQSENTPMSKTHRDQLLNLMVRFACQAVDSSQNGSLSEASVTRALSQLEFALRSDVWGGETCELRLSFIDRHLASEESVGGGVQSNSQVVTPSGASGGTSSSTSGQSAGHPGGPGTGTASATPGVAQSTTHPGAPGLGTAQTNHMLMTLEVLRVLFTSLESPTLLSNVKHFSGGLCSLLTRQLTNVRLIRSCANLLRAMLERFPADASHRQKITTHAELFDIYSTTSKTIQESFSLYSENGPKSTLLARLQSAFLLFQATQVHINPHAFVDRCIVQLVKLTHRLIQDVISPSFGSNAQDSGAGSQLTELLITSLEVIKSRLNVVSHEMRKNAFGPDLCLIMDRARDPRLFRTVIKILRDWINVPKSEEHFAPTAREKVSFFHRLWLAYPRWVDSAPDIAREILECVFEVYSSGNLFKNHDLYVKLEQAFCCSMLCPFPDIRERFIALYLDASQLYSIHSSTAVASAQSSDCKSATLSGMEALDSTNNSAGAGGGVDPYESTSSSPAHHADTDRDSASSAQGSDSQQSQLRAATTSSSLLVRLLFLFVSSNWDENHFRDEFWLPLFFDVLLCDVDTSLPPVLSTGSSLFPTLTGSRNSNPVGSAPEQKPSTSEFSRLVEWQIKGCKEYTAITFKEGLRGLLCLIHRHPALATQLMSQLWPQIWNRLLLRQPETCTNSVPDSGSGGCATAGTSLSVCSEQPKFSEHNSEELFRSGTTNAPEHKAAAGLDPMSSAVGFVGSNANNHSGPGCFSVNEIRGFVIPQLWRFLTSDQHVNPSEPQPSALGAFLSCLATTPDTVLMHIPLPAITYIGTAYNQWHSVTLFLESVCCRARKHGSDQTIPLTDFVFNVSLPTPESDTGGSFTVGPIQPSKMPTGSANLSLIALYDSMNEPDYLASAWWYRLTPLVRPQNAQGATRRQTGMLKCLEYAQHGLLLRSLECSLDQLAATTGASGLGSFDSTSGSGVGLTGIGGGGSASSNRAAAVAASTASAVARSQNASPLTLTGASNQLSDYVNRARLQDYCIRYLKQLGQWDSLETLASNMQTGSYMSTPFGAVNAGSCGNTGSGSTGGPGASLGSSGSAYWGLKADAAWRRSDWPEVYASLSRLANEAPRIDLCRYALIHGVACVAGRRTSSGFAAAVAAAQATVSSGISSSDSDPYGTGSIGESGSSACNTGASGSSQTPNASGAGAIGTTAASAASGSPMSTSGSSSTGNATVNSVVSIIQASEAESHRIMSTVLREWRRMPLIVTTQHVPLLQIAHRAVEVTEGNSLLAQYCGHVLSGPCLNQSMSAGSGSSTSGMSTSGAGSSAVSSAALRMPLSQALHDYKTVFKWWQSRPPSIGDDLGFWHDLFSWRQVVEESIITYHPYLQKFGAERANLIAMCERELALSQLQLARGARKCRFPSIAQQHLDRYTRMNLPPLFEKTKQEIKLKMAELRKDELLENTIRFSNFLQCSPLFIVLSYLTFSKREVAVSTTGIFAMQALMEAASVAGGQERRSRADLAKCLWLLTLDDDIKGQQRLARTFEERASRVRPDAFLPWLPSLVVSLLRPEGRFIVPALRGVTATHPTVLYNLLRGLQHQLTTEVLYDERLSELARTASSEPAGSYAHLLQTRIHAARGSRVEDSGRKLSRVGAGSRDEQGRAGAAPLDVPARGSGEFTLPRGSAGVTGPNVASTNSGGGGLATYSTVSPANSKKKKRVIVVMRGVEGDRLSGGSPLSPDQQQSQSLQSRPQAKKFSRDPGDNLHGDAEDEVSDGKISASKKSVVVVTSASDTDSASSSTRDPRGRIGITSESTQPDDTEDPDGAEEEEEDEEDTEDGEIDRDEMNGTGAVASSGVAGGSVSSSPASALPADARAKTSGNGLHDADGVGVTGMDQGTGCLSFSVTDGLHRINLLLGQIRRHHAARIYAVDLFTAEIGGRLQPSWAEQLLTRLCSLLDYLQRLAWTGVFSGKHWHPRSVEKLRVPDWLLLELRIQLSAACGSSIRVASVTRSGWARLSELGHSASSAADSLPHIPGSQARKRTSSASSTSSSSSPSSSSESDKEERSKKPLRAGRKQQLVGRDATKSKTEPSSVDSGSKFIREKLGSAMNQSSTKRALPTDTNRYVHRSSLRQISAFSEVTQIAAETARREADRDPWFMRTHRQLLKAVDDWENRSILYVMQRLTRHWIPLLEQRVACLPTRMLLSDYGAHRLIELPNLVVAVQSNFSTGPNVSGGTNSAMTSIPVGTNIVLPSVPCLELPGESGLLQSTGGFLNSSSFPYPTSQGSTTASVGPNLALHLVIAEVFPHVSRVRCSPGRLACPARRLGIRASNGRVFYYDLPALGIVPPISYSSSPVLASAMSVQLNASAGARTRSLMQARTRSWNMGPLTLDGLCPEPYTGWRHTGPLHLFQMINDVLAGQPETAKRRLALFTPRVMEIGPMGLCLTETSASTPAASVGIASAHPLPSANPVTARGLTALARPPPVTGAGGGLGSWIGSEWMSKPKSSGPGLPDWAVPFSQWDNVDTSTGVRDTRDTNKIKTTLPTPPPGPLPALVSSPNTSLSSNLSVGGSAAVAAEAIGRPCGLDAGCHPTCTSLTGVLEQACASWYQSHKVPKPSAERPFDASTRTADEAALYAGTRELVCLFYESLISSVSNSQQQSGKVTIPALCQLFHNLSQRLPQSPWVKNALISALGSLPDADCSADSTSYTESSVEFPRGNLLRNWAANRMLDAESYWLFRHNLASHLALIGLTEQLFHLTPTHPACLVMDPRSGRAESRHVLFNLPTCAPLFAGRAAEATALGSTNLSQISSLTTCFATVMGLCSPKVVSLPTDGKTSTHGRSSDSSDALLSSTDDTGKSPSWTHYPSPVPFRLTPHLAGFICLPGAPANVGPFAVSLTTAAQAFASAQRPNHVLSTLYRTMLRADYILWHRGRQAAVHAFHLLFGSDSGSTNPQMTGDSMDSDSDTDTEAGGHRRKTKLFNELGVKAVDSIRGDKGGSIAHVLPSSQQQQQQVQQQQKQLTSVQRQKSAGRDCVLLPDLTNEQLIQLITLTLDAMNTNLKGEFFYRSTVNLCGSLFTLKKRRLTAN